MDQQKLAHARQRKSVEADALTWSLQALLARHEAYVSEAEMRRATDSDIITDLTSKNNSLEAENTRLTNENLKLAARGEELNAALEESDFQVKGLTATLKETQNELTRVRTLVAGAERLEQEVVQLEMERQILQDTVFKSEEAERHAHTCWQASELAIKSLECQVEQMEKESRLAQDAQREIEQRAEKQKEIHDSVEAHRKNSLQAAHAGESSIVANFTDELMKSNAGLRIDLAEVRELLMRSQAETEELRMQISFQSPVLAAKARSTRSAILPGLDLAAELEGSLDETIASNLHSDETPHITEQPSYPPGLREVHIHHHTHIAPQPPPSRFRATVARHHRNKSSRSSVFTLHSRHESSASSIPSTVFESASDTGYETDTTSITGLGSPVVEAAFSLPNPNPILKKLTCSSNSRQHSNNESVLSVRGMDIHAPPSPRNWRVQGTPELSNKHASANNSASGAIAAGEALRKQLAERDAQRRAGRYNPVRDTFGALWGRKRGEGEKAVRRDARMIAEVVDEEGLKECLEE